MQYFIKYQYFYNQLFIIVNLDHSGDEDENIQKTLVQKRTPTLHSIQQTPTIYTSTIFNLTYFS